MNGAKRWSGGHVYTMKSGQEHSINSFRSAYCYSPLIGVKPRWSAQSARCPLSAFGGAVERLDPTVL